jgi:hypothetical protein
MPLNQNSLTSLGASLPYQTSLKSVKELMGCVGKPSCGFMYDKSSFIVDQYACKIQIAQQILVVVSHSEFQQYVSYSLWGCLEDPIYGLM